MPLATQRAGRHSWAMSDVQRYLDRAAELEEVAERFGPGHRAEYRTLAQSWREIAARLAAAEDDAAAA